MTTSREPKKHPGSGCCNATMKYWRVIDRHSTYSRGVFKHSESSTCKCVKCHVKWRTKADYIALLKDATAKERFHK